MKKIKNIISKLMLAVFTMVLFISSSCPEKVYAANACDPVSYVNTYGEKMRYFRDGYIRWGSKGASAETGIKYRDVGIILNITIGGHTYNTVLSYEAAYNASVVMYETRTSDYVYDVGEIRYTKLLERIKEQYSSADDKLLESLFLSGNYTIEIDGTSILTITGSSYTPAHVTENHSNGSYTISGNYWTSAAGMEGAMSWGSDTRAEFESDMYFGIHLNISGSDIPVDLGTSPVVSWSGPRDTAYQTLQNNSTIPTTNNHWFNNEDYQASVRKTGTNNLWVWFRVKDPNGGKLICVKEYSGTISNPDSCFIDSQNGVGNISTVSDSEIDFRDYFNEGKSKTYTIIAENENGQANVTTYTLNFDNTAPSINIENNTILGWYKNTTTIHTFTATDSLSGVSSIALYDTNGVTLKSQSYSAASSASFNYAFDENGVHTYKIVCTDTAGNKTEKVFSVKIDYDGPIQNISLNNNSSIVLTNEKILDWCKSPASIKLNITDSDSGVASSELYNITNGEVLIKSGITKIDFSVSADGVTNYKLVSTDNAGNTTTNTFSVRTDNTAPTVKMNYTKSNGDVKSFQLQNGQKIPDDGEWWLNNRSVKLNGFDSQSGMKSIKLYKGTLSSVSQTNTATELLSDISNISKNFSTTDNMNAFTIVSTDNCDNVSFINFTIFCPRFYDDNGNIFDANTDKSFEYTGKEIEPTVFVIIGDTKLINGTDYSVEYPDDHTNVGVSTILVKGIGKYSGEQTLKFKITPKPVEIVWRIENKINAEEYTAPFTVHYPHSIKHTIYPFIDNLSYGDSCTLSVVGNSESEVGNYTANVVGVSNKNYTLDGVTTEKKWAIIAGHSGSGGKNSWRFIRKYINTIDMF